jgi:hypothetical protein
MSLHRFEDAAFLQDFFLHNINSHGYMYGLIESFQALRHKEFPPGTLGALTAQTMMRADPIYVSDDVMTLWEHASKTFKLEPITRHDLVVPAGFAVLPRPYTMIDTNGKAVKYRVIAWLPISAQDTYDWDEGVEGQGIWLTMLSNVNDIDDYWTEQHKMSDGVSGATLRDLSLAAGQEWTLMHASALIFGENMSDAILVDSSGDKVPYEDREKGAEVYANIQCFWRLMSQLVMTPEPLPRQARRQRQREQRIETVKVLRLRRHRHRMEHEGNGAGIEYSHQWVVDGHWRQQPYGPRANPSYKQIWIAPYVKGPEDKPLVIKERGVEFTR